MYKYQGYQPCIYLAWISTSRPDTARYRPLSAPVSSLCGSKLQTDCLLGHIGWRWTDEPGPTAHRLWVRVFGVFSHPPLTEPPLSRTPSVPLDLKCPSIASAAGLRTFSR